MFCSIVNILSNIPNLVFQSILVNLIYFKVWRLKLSVNYRFVILNNFNGTFKLIWKQKGYPYILVFLLLPRSEYYELSKTFAFLEFWGTFPHQEPLRIGSGWMVKLCSA